MVKAKLPSCSVNLKRPRKSKDNIITINSTKKTTIEKAATITIDTELILELPEESKAFLATKFTGQHIKKITGPKNKRLWITLLNKSYFEKYIINKGDTIAYLAVEPESLKVQYEAKTKRPMSSRQKTKHPGDYLPKDCQTRWKNYWKQKKSGVSSSRTNGRVS